MSGSYLYCPTPGCGEYLGSLGADSCRHCGWSAGRVPEPDPDYAAIEREHLGDPDEQTGIYAPGVTPTEGGQKP